MTDKESKLLEALVVAHEQILHIQEVGIKKADPSTQVALRVIKSAIVK